eukprot:976733_1
MATIFATFSTLAFLMPVTLSSQCVDKSNEITTLEQECGLQSSHTVYFGSSFDTNTNTWLDISGNCMNVETGSISNPITTHPNALNGETYISGTSLTQIIFPDDVLPFDWTFFHVARYNDGIVGRIFQAYQHIHGYNWVFSTDQRNMYRSNGIDRTTSPQHSNYASIQYRLSINCGLSASTSDFAIAAIIVFDYELPLNQYECVEEYLVMKYNNSNPTTEPTNDPSSQPTTAPTDVPTTVPTSSPTTKSLSIQYINGNVSCNNLYENVGIEYDKGASECEEWCNNRADCEVFDYFEDFKEINDSRCYIFDALCDINVDEERKSAIGYFEFDKDCVNYPSNWIDSTGDDCGYYHAYSWCTNKTLLKNENDFYDLMDYKYQLTAMDACCECGGGIRIMDNVAFSTDNWSDFEDDILCTWQHSDFTPQS